MVVRKRTTPPLLFIATILGIGNPSLFLIFKPFNVILVPRPLQVDLGQVAKFYARSCSGTCGFAPILLELTALDQRPQLKEFRLPDPTRSEDKDFEFSGI